MISAVPGFLHRLVTPQPLATAETLFKKSEVLIKSTAHFNIFILQI